MITQPEDEQMGLTHLTAAMRTLQERAAEKGVGLTVVVLPFRQMLESAQPEEEHQFGLQEQIVESLRGLGIRTLETWPLFTQAAAERGTSRLFLNELEGDIHLSEEGHRLLADWLAPRLREPFEH